MLDKIKENNKRIRELQDGNILLEFGLNTFENIALRMEKDTFHKLFTKETLNVINLWGYKVKKDGTLRSEPNRIYYPEDIIEVIKLDMEEENE